MNILAAINPLPPVPPSFSAGERRRIEAALDSASLSEADRKLLERYEDATGTGTARRSRRSWR